MPDQTFKKAERLTNKKAFDELFNKGNSFTVSPFRIVYVLQPDISPLSGGKGGASLAISVPKRSFAKAVDRNRLKRRIREAYRKNKHILYEVLKNKNLTIALMLIYMAKEEFPYREIEEKIILSLRKLAEKI